MAIGTRHTPRVHVTPIERKGETETLVLMNRHRYLLSGVAAIYFGVIIGLTFTPGSVAARESWILPTILFVPVGLLLTLLMGRRRWWVAVGFGVLGAAWVEAAQTIWMPDGYASMADLMCASVGAILGTVLGVVVLTIRHKSMRSHGAPRIVTQAGNREIPQD